MTYSYDTQDTSFIQWLEDNNHLIADYRLLEEQYDTMLDECYPETVIGCSTFHASAILKELDLVAYQDGLNNHLNDRVVEVKEECYIITENLEPLWEEYLQELIDNAADDAVQYITRKLNEIAYYNLNDDIDIIDVRLNVQYDKGELKYSVLFGDSQSDTDHRGAWANNLLDEHDSTEDLAQELWDDIVLY